MGICPICQLLPADSREHVWPDWYLKRMDQHAAPTAAWTSNGEPIRNREGVQYAGRAQRERVLLDICEVCNNELDRRFEKPAKDLVDTVVKARWIGSLTSDQWNILGLWWTKVLLLLGLPDARYATPRINDKIVARFDAPEQLDLRWLTDGSPAPDAVSLYVHHADLANMETAYAIPIPSVVTDASGYKTHFHVLHAATDGVGFTVVSHPGWPIDHPLVSDGTGWELLHAPPPSDGDLSLLPAYGPRVISWQEFGAVLKQGHALDGTLPPLRATHGLLDPDSDVLSVLDHYEF